MRWIGTASEKFDCGQAANIAASSRIGPLLSTNYSAGGQVTGICTDALTKFAKSTPDGMKAIPPGLDIPFTIGVTNPVVRFVCPTNDSVGLAALGVENTLTAEYALAAKYGAVIA